MNEFDTGFLSSSDRIVGEAERRDKISRRRLSFNVSYLDDYCRALMPHDVVVIGARTGAGKTTLAEIIALTNAKAGKRVHYFALEAEPDEIERHLKFKWLSWKSGIRGFNYPDWYIGAYDDQLGFLEQQADEAVSKVYSTLRTFYKGRDAFTQDDITRLFLHVRNETDLIVLDHLHYVDTPDDQNDNRAQKEITKAIRDCALAIGVPIVVVVHLRKKPTRKTLLPTLDDVMGSSDITKIATRVILLAPATDQTERSYSERPTYMTVAKDRMCGGSNVVALMVFNLESGMYKTEYALGYMDVIGENFSLIDDSKRPRWAARCR